MQEWFTHDKVSVIYEHSLELGSAALKVYDDMKEGKLPYRHHFVTVAPGDWQTFPALQPADLLAYEGFKLIAAHKRGTDDLRKSLESVIGHGVEIRAEYFNCK